ncbi:ArpU family transcriptional regulator [Aquibacillus koreensis]|uniref:ArpU family transcriptional regulator n=1 Tax=Aquibacillus koreensis TaxID=279446 RepID=A0A9X3WHT2_9BACI|nr:ArpU family phage packaging/lysis transcriptional regulator [Aquibacillus koreensis]MCT2535698.1 ArpU family transcriptional regulator [Aquibacillus koreensis]MDC3420017.1 ArpU family transcriptional regulator [Aquibacillus koreensis]
MDREATRNAVEKLLERYNMYLLMDPIDMQPKITTSFTITPPTFTNQFHSKTENLVVNKIDKEKERHDFISKIQKAVNRLAYNERSVIIKRYMEPVNIYDYEVYNDLGFSERKYYRLKGRAFYKLAFILRVEVYLFGVPTVETRIVKTVYVKFVKRRY